MANLGSGEVEMIDFFELTPDLVCIAGKDGYFRKINPALIKKLGYTREELFAKPISSFIHPDDLQMTSRERKKLLKGRALINFQNRYVAKNGKISWFDWTSVYLPDKEIVFAIAKDVTERKKVEKEIEEKYKRFKSLATHFKVSLERDKKYLAIELHEELAQLASVVKMDMDWIKNHEKDLSSSTKSRLDHAIIISDLLINTIRRISFSISPGMLDDLGLNATLDWHCKEFSLLTGISCQYIINYDESDLTREIKLDFFRVCQEALTNIMYHAQAKKVQIRIEEADDRICLLIIDNGKGFDASKQMDKPGLKGIRERAASINGDLNIKSAKGKGTRVSVSIIKPSAKSVLWSKVKT
ncbi:MAG: PAS domain S-box protein [Chitinophagaceae bacterium]